MRALVITLMIQPQVDNRITKMEKACSILVVGELPGS